MKYFISGYVNTNRLPQDHPCVIDIIRNNYLQRPTNRSVPYKLSNPQILDPSDGQSRAVLRLLRNQVSVCENYNLISFQVFFNFYVKSINLLGIAYSFIISYPIKCFVDQWSFCRMWCV